MPDAFALLDRSGAYAYKGKLRLPTFTELGGYPLLYLTAGMDVLCSGCATTDYFEWLYSLNTPDEADCYDPPTTCDVYWEGPPDFCSGCDRPIESAYGDPDA